MFLKPRKPSTDPRLRSLLQKAVRRGHASVAERVVERLEAIGDRTWLRSRAVVITCEESWPWASILAVDRGARSKRDILVSVAGAAKQKDAAGLGAMAHAYHEGDLSTVEFVPNVRDLKIVAEALARPADFFDWLDARPLAEQSREVVRRARRYLPVATWQWDKACILASALLSTAREIPLVPSTLRTDVDAFPYWAALDKHTDEGKVALRAVATKIGRSYRQLIWVSFYCESASVNELLPSPWFEAERAWRLHRAGLSLSEAQELWEKAGPLVASELQPHSDQLKELVESTPSSDRSFL